MVGEAFAYGLSALSALGAIFFGLKQANATDKTGMAARLKDVEARAVELERRVQMLERREVWHERVTGIYADEIRELGGSLPTIPPPPEAWTT